MLYRPVKALNYLFELVDDELEISITVLPRVFSLLREKVYRKQKIEHGWKERRARV